MILDDLIKITDFPGYYVDREGRVWSRVWHRAYRTVTQFAPFPKQVVPIKHHGTDYSIVWLRKNNKNHKRFIHRLILEALTGPCPKGMTCRHLDGRRDNNHPSNLVWGTAKEQAADKIRHGTSTKGVHRPQTSGDLHPLAQLSNAQAREIYAARGIKSCKAIMQKYGISMSTVYNIWNKKKWKCIHSEPIL